MDCSNYNRKNWTPTEVLNGMSSVRDNAFVNYDVTTVEVNTSSDVTTGNINCDASSVQISNISNTDGITGDNECTIPDVATVPN